MPFAPLCHQSGQAANSSFEHRQQALADRHRCDASTSHAATTPAHDSGASTDKCIWSPSFECTACERAWTLLGNGVDPRTVYVDAWCRAHVPRCCTCNALIRAKRKGTDCKRNDRLMCLHRNCGPEKPGGHLCCTSSHFKEWMENSRRYYLR